MTDHGVAQYMYLFLGISIYMIFIGLGFIFVTTGLYEWVIKKLKQLKGTIKNLYCIFFKNKKLASVKLTKTTNLYYGLCGCKKEYITITIRDYFINCEFYKDWDYVDHFTGNEYKSLSSVELKVLSILRDRWK